MEYACPVQPSAVYLSLHIFAPSADAAACASNLLNYCPVEQRTLQGLARIHAIKSATSLMQGDCAAVEDLN